MKFEYVLSGMNMCNIVGPAFMSAPENIKATQLSIEDTNRDNDYFLSGLFNAYVEPALAKKVNDNYRHSFNLVQGDSGGLQVVTRGLEITPELKLQVYKTQAELADIGMCYDEIPLHVTESAGSSNRVSIDNKKFFVEEMEAAARKTGKNVEEQLRTFDDLNSNTQVMLIVQGNNRYDMAKWAEYAYSEVSDDLKSKIYGIAMADTCIGNGVLETVEMCAAIPMMNIPSSIKKNIHFLGVGSIARLIPIIELSRTPLFSDCKISFDSSSHSSSMVMGKFTTLQGRQVQMGKCASRATLSFLRDVYDEMSKYIDHDVTFDEYSKYVIDHMNTMKHLTDYSNYGLGCLANSTYWFTTLISARRFMDNVVKCQQDSKHYYNILSKQNLKSIRPLLQLANITNESDFDVWFNSYSKYVPSARIPRVESNNHVSEDITLHSFFQ